MISDEVQLIVSVLAVILAIAPMYMKIGKLEGELDMLHEKVVSLCRKIDKMNGDDDDS